MSRNNQNPFTTSPLFNSRAGVPGWPNLPKALPGVTTENTQVGEGAHRQPARPAPLKYAAPYLSTNAGRDPGFRR